MKGYGNVDILNTNRCIRMLDERTNVKKIVGQKKTTCRVIKGGFNMLALFLLYIAIKVIYESYEPLFEHSLDK